MSFEELNNTKYGRCKLMIDYMRKNAPEIILQTNAYGEYVFLVGKDYRTEMNTYYKFRDEETFNQTMVTYLKTHISNLKNTEKHNASYERELKQDYPEIHALFDLQVWGGNGYVTMTLPNGDMTRFLTQNPGRFWRRGVYDMIYSAFGTNNIGIAHNMVLAMIAEANGEVVEDAAEEEAEETVDPLEALLNGL